MKNEELYLRQRISEGNPYRVPDGYFDRLEQNVMQRIRQEEAARKADSDKADTTRKARIVSLRRWSIAAAVALLVGVSTTLFMQRQEQTATDDSVSQHMMANVDADYIEQAADYLMADNNEIYAYLAYE